MGINVGTIETLMSDVCSGDVQVAALTQEETRALTGYVHDRRDRLHAAGFTLPPLPEDTDDVTRRDYLTALADFTDRSDDAWTPGAYDIDGEWRDSGEQRFGYRRFRQAYADAMRPPNRNMTA